MSLPYEDIIGGLDAFGTELAGSEELSQLLAGYYHTQLLAGAAPEYYRPSLMVGADPGMAAAAAKAAGKKAFLQQLALKGAGSAVVSRSATKSRVYSQGFGPVDLAAAGEPGDTKIITVQPQVTFKGKRLVIGANFSTDLMVNDLKIGNVSQLPSSNPLPADAFREDAVGMQQDFDTAQISQQIVLSVTNLLSSPRFGFMALLNGIIVA